MNFTLNDIALLLIALVAGMILGLMVSGRGKYRQLWRDEQAAHRAAIKDRDTRISAFNARIAEMEKQSGPIGPGTAAAVAGGVAGRDDLSRIKGISQAQEITLNESGYQRYRQIATLNAEQEATLEVRLGLSPGTIASQAWREQARALDGGARGGVFGRFATPV